MSGHRCPPCSAAWLAWLDYTLPPVPIVLCSPGRGVREIRASQERRYQDWRETIRFHQDLITRQCAALHNLENLFYAYEVTGFPPQIDGTP